MRKFYLPLFLILFSACAFSQFTPAEKKVKVYGLVTDERDSAMMGVVVTLRDKQIGTVTDSTGRYELMLPTGSHVLEFKYISYTEQRFPMLLRDTMPKMLNVKMSSEAKNMGIVVVTGSKYEKKLEEEVVSMEVMKASVINQNSARMDEAMNKVPGVNMLGRTIAIRGGSGFSDATGNRVMALLDDLPIISPENGGIRWESLPIEEMEQVEVIKGSSSALYGSSALNGVLNIRTVNPTPEGMSSILINYGFYGQPRQRTWDWWWTKKIIKHNGDTVSRVNRPMFGGGQLLHAKQYGDFGVVVSGAFQRDQGFRQNNDYDLARFGAKLRYTPHKLQRLTAGVNFNVFYENLKDFFASAGTGPLTYVPMQVTNTYTFTFNVDPYFNYYDKHDNRHSLKFRIYDVQFASTTGDSSQSVYYYVDYSFLRQFKKIDLVVTTGVNASYSVVQGKTFGDINSAYFNTRHVANAAAYIQAEKKFFHRLTLTGGMRLEYTKLDTSVIYYPFPLITKWEGKDSAHQVRSAVAPLFRFGMNFQAAKGTFIRASIGQGFRYPSLAEKFVFTTRSGAEVFPNPNLRPESGWSAEVGIKQTVKVSEWAAYFDLAGYVTRYRDMIEFQVDNDPTVIAHAVGIPFQAVNITRAMVAGVEVSTVANGKIFGVPLNFLAGYSYLYPENLDYNPKDPNSTKILKYRIQHSAKADIQATYKGVIMGVSAFYNSFMKNIDNSGIGILQSAIEFRNTHHNGDFVMDVRVGYNYKEKVTFNFICKNILNTEYTFRPALVEAPRNFTFQVGYKF